jgi:hypothetical protein
LILGIVGVVIVLLEAEAAAKAKVGWSKSKI